ncbi:MAG: hypothetical protein ABWZ40_07290 [Caulobacterales bacterium]
MKPAPLPGVIHKTLKYNASQEHFLRRLGSALVMQWDEVPNDVQDLIIDQAGIVDDRDEAAPTRADFEGFLRGVKTTALQKKPAPEDQLDA